VRSFLIHRLGPLATDPALLLGRLEDEREVSRRRALVLSLGAYPVDRLGGAVREKWLGRLRRWYRDEPDAGLHGAVEWLLRRWGDGAEVARAEKELARKEAERSPGGADAKPWYVNGQGQTLVVVPRPGEFWMGSPGHEAGRGDDEPLRRVRIPRSFAIAAKEVTVAQFKSFRPDYGNPTQLTPWPDGPINTVSWYEAAEYCNWLSGREGIPEDQWCYLPNANGKYGPGMRLAPGALERRGYRLPTEAEWEYACRAGAATRRYYGDADGLLGEYAWYSDTTRDKGARPGGLLKPNDLGLFDLYGNVMEWVLDLNAPWRRPPGWPGWGRDNDDVLRTEETEPTGDDQWRYLRGGCFSDHAPGVRSADRSTSRPSLFIATGFRVARTEP
jgi:formylglycine-generating enzyme required for sulfatase activity